MHPTTGAPALCSTAPRSRRVIRHVACSCTPRLQRVATKTGNACSLTDCWRTRWGLDGFRCAGWPPGYPAQSRGSGIRRYPTLPEPQPVQFAYRTFPPPMDHPNRLDGW